jgi:hypothetical protein
MDSRQNVSRAEHKSKQSSSFLVLAELSRVKLSSPDISGEEAAMMFDDFPLNPSPSDVDTKGGAADEEDVADYWDGIPLTCAELADEMNAMARGEIPMPVPSLKELSKEDQLIMEDLELSEMAMDYPWGPLFPEDEELCQRGIRETMFDTLPEMEIILENECIL